MFNAIRINLFIILSIFVFLTACESTLIEAPPPIAEYKSFENSTSKKLENEAMLSDPAIKKDFRVMKKIAIDARLYKKNGRYYFSENDIKKLNAISNILLARLSEHYHLNPTKNKIHTYIGRNKYGSCYQYYNSLSVQEIGHDCKAFSGNFSTCDICSNYIKALRSRSKPVIHAEWWNHEKISALVDTLKLKNGDVVYLGLEFSQP